MSHPLSATVLGYPRIGANRELKKTIESYWDGAIDGQGLQDAAADISRQLRSDMRAAGLTSIPSNVFSLYDHVLDAAVTVDAVPSRYRSLGLSPTDTYFAMARGNADIAPLELTKWFDTNYHYLVPELGPDTVFRAVADKPVTDYRQALAEGVQTRPVLLGPVTFLLLAKAAGGAPAEFAPLDLLESLVDCYAELLATLAGEGADWVQLDEPAFNLDRDEAELAALGRAYSALAAGTDRPKLFVTGGYGEFGTALPVLLSTPIEAVGLDLVAGQADLTRLASLGAPDKIIVAGLVDGRNIWRVDTGTAAARLATLLGITNQLGVSTSCSLLHVPVDVEAETELPQELRSRLSFARQKLGEVVELSRILTGQTPPNSDSAAVPAAWRNDSVRARLAALRPEHRRRIPYAERVDPQQRRLGLPDLPTTTIGSFPQTGRIRAARAAHRTGRSSDEDYQAQMRSEIAQVIALQERLGLDVLVHGEPERNDMVQYFAESLTGFAATRAGWVQSYGSRCVRPPILYGDVTRVSPITVDWSKYAQSLTEKPVKGMLTGPVTILAWSFVRVDQPLADTANQVALALREEVRDLEAAGLRVIQVDEPALRELLPPRRSDRADYLEWAVSAFRLATSGVSSATQIHTHLCYSEFGEVLDAIGELDADVTSLEASRSNMEVLDDLRTAGYARGVGPGVYDIHSPRVPGAREIAESLQAGLRAVPANRLWVNPDCGLKTRGYAEVEPALTAMVRAAQEVRKTAADS